MRFAAFIMTYERPGILLTTISRLLAQTCPPEKILIVDNSESSDTRVAIEKLNHPQVEYFGVGYNAGPAGAAKIGLQRLADEGFDWIYWGDDDDPPSNAEACKNLLDLVITLNDAGAVGSLGGMFNPYTGRTRNLMNRELGSACEVDFVPGGKNFIVNADVARMKILPSEELFFGFEELDYCLKIKRAGFKIYVDGKAWLESRMRAGNIDDNYRWRGKSFHRTASVRHYYSARNMLFVLRKNGLYFALMYTFIKTFGKSLLSFRFGMRAGLKLFSIYNLALFHFLISKKGQQVVRI